MSSGASEPRLADERLLRELYTLNAIAQTLNQAVDLDRALSSSLGQLVRVMGLSTGWIFLLDHAGEFHAAADSGLPPALAKRGKRPIRFGGCDCQDLYLEGRFDEPVKNVECSRLAKEKGEKYGLKNHASVALRSGERFLGIMNVATPDWGLFTAADLQLLSAVGHQMGVAIERARLYQEVERRASDLQILVELQRRMAAAQDEAVLLADTLATFAQRLSLAYAVHVADPPAGSLARAAVESGQPQIVADLRRRPRYAAGADRRRVRSALAVRLRRSGRIREAIEIGSEASHAFGPQDAQLLDALAFEIASALDVLRLHRQSRQLAALEERHRLARDLHDSVTQTLFSLNLNAQAAALSPERAAGQLPRIQALAQSALSEMRTLIQELRPSILEEKGLPATVRRLLDESGLPAELAVREGDRPSPEIEMSFYRILKEALHNAARHARAGRIRVELDLSADPLRAVVEDDGVGFEPATGQGSGLGLRSMAERASAHGGRLEVESGPGRGTRIRVEIPRA